VYAVLWFSSLSHSILPLQLCASNSAPSSAIEPRAFLNAVPSLHKMLHLPVLIAAAFVASPGAGPLTSSACTVRNLPGVEASAKILPVACVGLGGALLSRASGAAGAERAVLGSAGLLSIFNLAPTDSARYASGKRAVKNYEGRQSLPYGAQAAADLAKKWYKLVQARQLGQLVGLVMMIDSRFSVLTGAAVFMGANVGFLALGSGDAKHDDDGLPAPMKPGLYKLVLGTDVVLLSACLAGVTAAAGSARLAVASYVFSAGCLIGAAEGVPKFISAVKGLVGA
jgi:hypothetical protein